MARHIDKITIGKIMDATNIVDVISDFLDLRKRGVEYVCLCPFHNDETLGNFSINPNKGIYKCFACGAGGNAVDFLMKYNGSKLTYPDALRYLAKKYSIAVPDDGDDDRWKHIKPAQPRKIVEVQKLPLIMPRDVVTLTMGKRPKDDRLLKLMPQCQQPNNFIDWITTLPWMPHQRKMLQSVLWLYCVGRFQHRVVFWQIDEQGQPHGGKLMAYYPQGPKFGKRLREGNDKNPGWLHNQDGIRQLLDLEHYGYHATLFGLHLMNRYPQADFNIVESEKTALLMTIFQSEPERHLWMACGGLEHLKVESLRPLIESGRRVWIWPDKDGTDKWREKVKHLLSERVTIYTGFFDRYWLPEDGPKADVADIQLRLLCHPETDKEAKANYEARLKTAGECQVVPYVSDEPFLDPIELGDPRVHEWRQKLRQRYNFRKIQPPTTDIEGVKSVGEILSEHPLLKQLINEE